MILRVWREREDVYLCPHHPHPELACIGEGAAGRRGSTIYASSLDLVNLQTFPQLPSAAIPLALWALSSGPGKEPISQSPLHAVGPFLDLATASS